MAEDNDLPEKQPGDFTEMTIGIYGVSSQSGRAYFADYISKGYSVIGYARPSGHGKNIVSEITKEKGLWLRRPQNQNDEMTRFVTLGRNKITNEISKLVELSDIIIIAIPSNYHSEAVEELKVHGLAGKKIPIILSPSRTFAPPYIWKVLGNNFPVVCFSTVPYSCKALAPATVYIKRRKRTWFASLEGKFHADETNLVRKLFPQAVLSTAPAATSLNNIGAVFHPASYLLNLEEIEQAKKENRSYSFYIEGIARKPNIGKYIEKIDQVRLSIAHNLGIETFGLASDPREDAWRAFMQELRMAEGKETTVLSQLNIGLT
jgi:opine dehydrogenase